MVDTLEFDEKLVKEITRLVIEKLKDVNTEKQLPDTPFKESGIAASGISGTEVVLV